MQWPQITMIVLYGLNIGISCAKDGQPKEGKYSGITAIISCVIAAWILYQGGFFGPVAP